MQSALKELINNRLASVSVIGLGYVGLPLCVDLCAAGYKVYGMDICEYKVENLKNGQSYICDVKNQEIQQIVDVRFFPTSDFSFLSLSDVIFICVPTPLTEERLPDASYIEKAVDEIAKHIKKDTVIILESTTYPGTSDNIIRKVIETTKGFIIGKDFYVCYSPERVDPGNKNFRMRNTPKIIGGCTPGCLEIGCEVYRAFVSSIIPVKDTSTAEMVKLVENTFRSVNIAVVNELAIMCDRMKINIWEVIDAAATKPFGYMPFYPGPGTGGHCIPLDPMYLSWAGKTFKYYNRFIETASDINENMPFYIAGKIYEILNKNGVPMTKANILLCGIAYKKNVNDARESPALVLFKLLKDRGAEVSFYDPYVNFVEIDKAQCKSIDFNAMEFARYTLVVITTDHDCVDYKSIAAYSTHIFDTRNVFKGFKTNNITLLGG